MAQNGYDAIVVHIARKCVEVKCQVRAERSNWKSKYALESRSKGSAIHAFSIPAVRGEANVRFEAHGSHFLLRRNSVTHEGTFAVNRCDMVNGPMNAIRGATWRIAEMDRWCGF